MNRLELVKVNPDEAYKLPAENENLIIHNLSDYRIYWSYSNTGPWIPIAPLDSYEIKGKYEKLYLLGSQGIQDVAIERRGKGAGEIELRPERVIIPTEEVIFERR